MCVIGNCIKRRSSASRFCGIAYGPARGLRGEMGLSWARTDERSRAGAVCRRHGKERFGEGIYIWYRCEDGLAVVERGERGECPIVNTYHQSCFIGRVRNVPRGHDGFATPHSSSADKCLAHHTPRLSRLSQHFFS